MSEAGVNATVLPLRAQYGERAAGAVLRYLYILIGCKLLSILEFKKEELAFKTKMCRNMLDVSLSK